MADRGILFSASMVAAIIDGRKTQTRRLITPQPPTTEQIRKLSGSDYHWYLSRPGRRWTVAGPTWAVRQITGQSMPELIAPYAKGDRLYVRESYYQFGHWEQVDGVQTKGGQQKWKFVGAERMVTFDPPADFLTSRSKPFPGAPRWYKRLGRFMPRAYSRLTLGVTDVHIERLQHLCEDDARAEGLGAGDCDGMDPRGWYRELWDSLHTKPGETWADNPWIVAVTFDVAQRNIDAEAA